jgi:prephenate dehydratase
LSWKKGIKLSLIIAFQGENGAYSEQAIRQFYQQENIKSLACMSFAEALEAVAEKRADFAMIPVENSIAKCLGSSAFMLVGAWYQYV